MKNKENKTQVLSIRLSTENKKQIKSIAKARNVTVSKFIRSEILENQLTLTPRSSRDLSESLHVRVTEAEKNMLYAAAKQSNQSVTEIVLENVLNK